PVWPRFDRAGNPVFTPPRNPLDLRDRVQRSCAQIIDPNKELIDRTEDDRRLRAPAIGIAMMKIFFTKQHSAITEHAHDVAISIENIFADELGNSHFLGVSPMIVDRRKDW